MRQRALNLKMYMWVLGPPFSVRQFFGGISDALNTGKKRRARNAKKKKLPTLAYPSQRSVRSMQRPNLRNSISALMIRVTLFHGRAVVEVEAALRQPGAMIRGPNQPQKHQKQKSWKQFLAMSIFWV